MAALSTPSWRGERRGGALLLGVTLALSGCALGSGESRAEGLMSDAVLEAGPYAVGSRDFTWVDASRPTMANGSYEGADSRTLKTTVWYPGAPRGAEFLRPGPMPVAEGSFPVLAYSHGFMSFRSEGAFLAEHLASHGYVVVAANFPLSNYFAPGDPNLEDVVNQPGDVSFLIDQILAEGADPESPFAGRIDEARIATAGLSLGGLTTALVGYHPRLRDPRLKAAISIAGPASMFDETYFHQADLPFMMIAGDIDAIVPYEANVGTLMERSPHVTVVTLKGASHTNFTDVADPMFRFVHNADAIGCGQIEENLPDDFNLIREVSQPGEGILIDDPPMPCQEEELPEAMRPAAQHRLVTLAAFSFLQMHLAEEEAVRAEAEAFLYETLDGEQPELSVKAPEQPEPEVMAKAQEEASPEQPAVEGGAAEEAAAHESSAEAALEEVEGAEAKESGPNVEAKEAEAEAPLLRE